MNVTWSNVRALLGKELRQVRRSRGALISSTVLPLMLMVVTPIGQYASISGGLRSARAMGGVPPGLAGIDDPRQLVTLLMMPLMMVVTGLVVPSMAAAYTIVTERERRTGELLVALPVRVGDIVVAKLLAMLAMTGLVLGPLFAIDAGWLIGEGLADPSYVLWLATLLTAAVVCSVAVTLVVALIARDLRTANQVSGVFVGPLVLMELGALLVVGGDLRWLLAVALPLVVGALALVVALRWLTFERYVG